MEVNNSNPHHRFYEFLPKLVDAIDNYIREAEGHSKKHEQQLKELRTLANQISAKCEKDSFVNFDPAATLIKMKQEAILSNERKFLRSYSFSKLIRQIFYSNIEIREANDLSNIQSTVLSEADSSNCQRDVDQILDNQNQYLSRSPPLNFLVDSSLRPIYSTYFHLYEPKYFPSTHKAINSYYISSLLPILIRANQTSSISAYESELVSTKDILLYLIEYSLNSRTEYELFELERKLPNPQVIQDSSLYLQKKDELDNIVKSFTEIIKNYDRQFENFKNVFDHLLKKMESQNKLISDSQKKLSTLHKRVETVTSSFRALMFIDQVFKNQQTPKPISGPIQPSIVSLFQPIIEWSGIQDAILDIVTSDAPADQDLDNSVADLNAYLTKLRNVRNHLFEKEKSKEVELGNSRVQFTSRNSNIDFDLINKFEDSNQSMEKLHNDAFKENMDRIKIITETSNEYGWHFCSVSRIIERKPISNLIEPMISLSDPSKIETDNSEIKRRMQEVAKLESLLNKREEEFQSDEKNILDFKNVRLKEEKERKEKTKTLTIAAIDEKYTETRMFVTCTNCDNIGEFVAKPCKHMICKKCFEKSKKKRTSYCPFCGQVVDKFTKINW